jgi:drug/metabolite transporter (DMT)-like permease
VALFLPGTAVVLLVAGAFMDEPRAWSAVAGAEALGLGFATYFAYTLWDNAMRQGDVVLVASASYMTPLFSTLFSCLYLAVIPPAGLWVGCVVLVAGSLISRWSVYDPPVAPPEP